MRVVGYGTGVILQSTGKGITILQLDISTTKPDTSSIKPWQGSKRYSIPPFINKNVKNSVRIQSLAEMLSTGLFIQVKRDRLDMASSILKGRKDINGNVEDWWSVMPKEIDLLKRKNYLEQICGQIYYVERNIEEDVTLIGKERLHTVQYDDLCDYPKRELDKISSFVNMYGYELRTKYDVPKSFRKSRSHRSILSDRENSMKAILARY